MGWFATGGTAKLAVQNTWRGARAAESGSLQTSLDEGNLVRGFKSLPLRQAMSPHIQRCHAPTRRSVANSLSARRRQVEQALPSVVPVVWQGVLPLIVVAGRVEGG